MKKGLPAVNYLGDVAQPLEFDNFSESEENKEEKAAGDNQGELDAEGESAAKEAVPPKKVPPKADEYEWVWKVKFSCGLHCPCPPLTSALHTAGARNIEAYILPLMGVDTRAFTVGVS